MRKSVLPWLACAIIALIVVPALAWSAPARDPQPSTPKADAAFTVGDFYFVDAAGSAPEDNSVTINVGDSVTFTYAKNGLNNSVHNVDFSADTQPASCSQSEADTGLPLDADGKSPMPDFTQPPGWSGECTFSKPGTYTFFCDAHGDMTGEIKIGRAHV